MSAPLERVPRLSHEEPAQPIGPCTIWATSAIGSSALRAPSKQHPPCVAPGCGLAQPDFDLSLWAQAGSFMQREDFVGASWPAPCVSGRLRRKPRGHRRREAHMRADEFGRRHAGCGGDERA